MSVNDDNQDDNADFLSIDENLHPTACFNCRQARQRCDRHEPCLRCTGHSLECKYPTKSNRGRKRGSTNKPDTVEKLLSRINDSSVRDEVIAAILKNHQGVDPLRSPVSPPEPDPSSGLTLPHDKRAERGREDAPYCRNEVQDTLYSPLQILAAAVVAEKDNDQTTSCSSQTPGRGPRSDILPDVFGSPKSFKSSLVDERLSRYFAPHIVDRTDWDVLCSQPRDSRFGTDVANCEPVAAGLIDQSDVTLYFDLYVQVPWIANEKLDFVFSHIDTDELTVLITSFYNIRNPFIALLDPGLHTPTYVRSKSFTLFSVVCALGSAISTRPRDRLLHPLLSALAEENIKWSIAASVKSVEIVQAIINMTYWAPTYESLGEDPYWLRLSHATQLARELGIHRPASIAQKLNALQISNLEEKERMQRNYQRTWFYVFIVDKSFGMTTGRALGVSHSEVPTNVGDWWKRPSATVMDRMIVGCIEYRVQILKAFEERQRLSRTRQAIINWQRITFQQLSDLRSALCVVDHLPSATYSSPILTFYLDHGLMAVNAHASRDLISIDGHEHSEELITMSRQTMEVAMRFIDLVVLNELMVKLMLGLHNTQLIMISHCATEVIHAIKRNLSAEDATHAAYKIHMLANHVETIANGLPQSSWASLYLRLFRFFVGQLEDITAARRESNAGQEDHSHLFTDWWKFVDMNTYNFAGGIDMGFIGTDSQVMDANWDFNFPS